VLNFTAGSGQIIMSNPSSHALADVIVSAILTVATVRTRASKAPTAGPAQPPPNGSNLAPGGWAFKPGFAQTKKEDEWWWVALVILGWALYILFWITIIASFFALQMMMWFFACFCNSYYWY
jgi:hypothetical protein